MVNFEKTIKEIAGTGYYNLPKKVNISIPDAKKVLMSGIKYFTGESARWCNEYDEIVEWLTDNKGRGLMCYGNCGRGKTLICGKIIPVIFMHYYHKVVSCYDAQKMNEQFESVIQKHIIYIDDLGTEGMSVRYGEKKMCFPELADEAEKKGKMLIISTNLTIDEMKVKYGERTVDRLKAITKTVMFKGKSLRK